jgi:formylglycine-generating enzyme required for sulfatase activity
VRLWKAFLGQLERDYPGNRVIFSCRSLDYSVTLSAKESPVPQVRIEPLSDSQVRDFIRRYCPQHGEALWQNLHGTRQLDLLRSPYYLHLLIAQTTTGDIPAGRAALFTGFVRQALRREVAGENALFEPNALLHPRDVQRLTQARAWRTAFELPERGLLFPKLSHLAFQMQMRRTAQEAGQVRLAYDQAINLLDHERAEDMISAAAALGVLDDDRDRDQVLYVHQLLQEYFAARQLAQQPRAELVQQEWRAHRVIPSLQETLRDLADSDPLPPLPGTGWEETTALAAAMAKEPDRFVTVIMAHNLALAGRCAAQPEVAVSDALKQRLRWALVARTQDPEADLRARIAAGLALGELGDPRFQRGHGPDGDYLLPPMIEIAGGSYTIGSDEGLYADEAPVHEVELQAFNMAQFPVTNAEWTLFMQTGGYEDERWWDTPAARAWRRGEDTAEGPKRDWREFRKQLQEHFERIRQLYRENRITSEQADDWEQIARMPDDDFEALLDTWYPPGRQTQPAYWNDDVYNNPAQPVVGICWFEARAYCAWLSAQTGQTFRLPTEAEWEAAARGVQGRRYAFGGDFDAARCNTFETHIRHPTPIDVFPGGETPDTGLVDMTGNTWDWTSSQYKDYPYNAADGREHPAAHDVPRVVRGGSWRLGRDLARASYRHHSAPHGRLDHLGLRVVRASHIVIPLLTAQLGLYGVAWLLRACPPELPARATLPVLAADHGLRPEAKGIKMAQVSPVRTDVAHKSPSGLHTREASPGTCLETPHLTFIHPPSKRPSSATMALTCRYCPWFSQCQ